jgi:hypothetical protein
VETSAQSAEAPTEPAGETGLPIPKYYISFKENHRKFNICGDFGVFRFLLGAYARLPKNHLIFWKEEKHTKYNYKTLFCSIRNMF